MNATSALELLAPLSGLLVPLDQVPDPVFSTRLIGDGICIDPTCEVLRAPLSGVISNIQDSGHALGITHDQGVQVLMHIGLDTVNLAGQGFTARVREGERVEVGQVLIEFDADYLALHARSLLTLMLVVSGEPFDLLVPLGERLESGRPLLALGAPGEVTAPVVAEAGEALFSEVVRLPNAHGLHARPTAVLVQAAKGFAAQVQLHRSEDQANAKSLVAIMALQTVQGDRLRFSATGADAQAALDTLVPLLLAGCGETSLEAADALPVVAAPPVVEAPLSDGLAGTCAAPGSAYGRVTQLAAPVFEVEEQGAGVEAEAARLNSALQDAAAALQRLRDAAGTPEQGQIFRAHQELLDDPQLLDQAQALLAQGKSAAFAWRAATAQTSALFTSLGSDLLAERALDLMDVSQRVLRLILGLADTALQLPDATILVAEQLTPSQTAGLDTSKVLGFVTVGGGATSHVAILARAFGLPALCGVSAQVLGIANGTAVLLDADRGRLHLDPDAAAIQALSSQRQQQRQRRQRETEQAHEPACTLDGHHLEVSANVASLQEVEQALELGAAGVGLLRSEFLYLQRASAPSVEEQAGNYSAIADVLGPERQLVVRTLDVGGDKPLAYVPMDHEANPFLGMRGIRLCLQRPQLLRQQLRAILACAGQARLHIMLPMVSQLAELRQARAWLEEEARALGVTRLPQLGIMIEVPAAALMADLFAAEVDFFSIGTNDLTQYTLAMDRDHPQLASQADSLHPAVLRLIATTVKAAHAHGKWVGVCGALASEVLAVPLLLGLGVDELSVSVPLVPAIKAAVREVELTQCQALAQRVLGLEDAGQVRAALDAFQPTAALPLVLEN